jgi:hypothetical protein
VVYGWWIGWLGRLNRGRFLGGRLLLRGRLVLRRRGRSRLDALDNFGRRRWGLALRAAARPALDQSGFADVSIVDAAGQGPFDHIFVNGACEVRPDALAGLLADGGRMVAVEGLGRSGRVMLYQRSGDVVGARAIFDAAAPVLIEFRKPPSFVL